MAIFQSKDNLECTLKPPHMWGRGLESMFDCFVFFVFLFFFFFTLAFSNTIYMYIFFKVFNKTQADRQSSFHIFLKILCVKMLKLEIYVEKKTKTKTKQTYILSLKVKVKISENNSDSRSSINMTFTWRKVPKRTCEWGQTKK